MEDGEENEIDVEPSGDLADRARETENADEDELHPLEELFGGGEPQEPEELPEFDEVVADAVEALQRDETMLFGLVIAYDDDVEIEDGSGQSHQIRFADYERLDELDFMDTLKMVHKFNDQCEDLGYPTELPGGGGLFGF